MENPAYIALSRQTSLMRQMDVIANNIANAATPGYKGEHVLFAEFLAQGRSAMPMSYVEDIAVARDPQQGLLLRTEASLDFAIEGAGYFVVETPLGERYTRAGHFQLDADGRLVTSQGYAVLDDAGQEIRIPPDTRTIAITRDAMLSADAEEVARIRLVAFDDEQALRKTMSGLYTTDQPPQPAVDAELLQGMVEESNVQPIVEMTRMMEILRDFQATQNMLDGEHERKVRAIRELPRTQPS